MVEYIKSFQLFTEKEISDFLDRTEIVKLTKGQTYVRPGQICKSLAYVKSGIFRSYYYSSNDDEITYCFTFPNHLLMAYSSFISERISEEIIQALSDTEIISISKENLKVLEASNPKWTNFLKIIAEQEYLELEKWIFNHQKHKAQERYRDLLIKNPEYIQKIPLQYIASYLGVTQRHLSRIRENISY